MPEQLWFTVLLNKVFGGPVNAFLQTLPPAFHPTDPQAPITNAFAMEVFVVGILIMVFVLIRSRLSAEKPGGLQHLAEVLHEFIGNQETEIIGGHHRRFTPILSALFLFILISNLIGLIPSFESPTATPAVPLGCAVVVFVYYNYHGVRAQGPLGYLKHFLGPMWWLSPVMFPIEIIGNVARLMSLTVRLYANMFAGDMVTLVFFSLIPIGLPVVFLGLHTLVSFLQAYIFTLLTTIYLAGAVAHEH
ncbi:MAG TPA: F0F1 ATP synthase subunit A [Candidatus Angelobacter sp.]|jgi:F-type H+-transporting ATPase subunit a|nr:F0F1 ATP synthase subunit A [Candidatus Angelobacter sp.]